MKLSKLIAISLLCTSSVCASQHSDLLDKNLDKEQVLINTVKQNEKIFESFESTDPQLKKSRVVELYSVAMTENIKISDRLSATKSLFDSIDLKIKALGAQAKLTIAKDEKIDSYTRLEAADLLFNCTEPEIKELSIQAAMTIMKDEKIGSYWRVNAAKILFDSTDQDIKNRCVEAYLCIVKNEKANASIRLKGAETFFASTARIRLKAAEIFFASTDPENKKLGIEMCQSIMKNENVYTPNRLDAAKILFDSTDLGAKKLATEVCQSIMKNKKVDLCYRLDAAKIFFDSTDPEIKKLATEGYQSIMKGEKVEIRYRLATAKILFDSTDPENKKLATEGYQSIMKDEKVDLCTRFNAAKILLDSTDPEIKKLVTEWCQSIVKNEKGYTPNRLDAAKILFDSTDLGAKKLATEVCQSIMKNEKVYTLNRLDAAKILSASTDPEAKKLATEVCQSIMKDEKEEIRYRLDATKLLFDSKEPETKELGVQAYMTIVKDETVLHSIRHGIAKDFYASTDLKIKELGAQAFLFIMQGKTEAIDYRLETAKNLFASTDLKIKELGAQAYMSIAKDEKVEILYRLHAAKILFDSTDPENKKLATEGYQSIMKDEKVEIPYRLDTAKTLFDSTDLELKKTVLNIAEQSMSTGNKEVDKQWAGFLIQKLPETDELFQKALYLLIDMDKVESSKSIYAVHGQLLTKLKEEVVHNPILFQIEGFNVTLNAEKIQNAMKLIERPNATPEDFLTLVKGIFEESSKGESVQKYLTDILGSQKLTKDMLLTYAENKDLKSLLTPPSSNTKVDPIAHKFAEIVQHLKDLPTDGFKNELSIRSLETLQLMINLISCSTAKSSAIENAWHHLKEKTIIVSLDESVLEKKKSEDLLCALLDKMLREYRNDLLNGDDQLVRTLTETPKGKQINEPEHQSQYLHKVLGEELGLHFPGQIVKIDWNGEQISNKLMGRTRQELLDQFYQLYTSQAILKVVTDTLNGYIKDNYGLTMNMLQGILEVKSLDDSAYFKTTQNAENLYDTTTKLTPFGSASLLVRLGFLLDVSKPASK